MIFSANVRVAARILIISLLCLGFTGCITPNGVDPNGNTFLFKTFGLVNTPIGEMELTKGLGLPYALANPIAGNGFSFSKPTIFLPTDIESIALHGDYWVNGSSIIVISAPTAACQYDYILITINPNSTYFARRVEPCDHDIAFAADANGVTMTEQGVDDPRLWWISDTNFTGPIQQSVVAASDDESDGASGDATEDVSGGGSDDATTPTYPMNHHGTRRHHAPTTATGVAVQAAYVTTRHLQYISLKVATFSIPTGGDTTPIPICMADGSTCNQ